MKSKLEPTDTFETGNHPIQRCLEQISQPDALVSFGGNTYLNCRLFLKPNQQITDMQTFLVRLVYYKMIEEIDDRFKRSMRYHRSKPSCVVFEGDPGIGKSTFAYFYIHNFLIKNTGDVVCFIFRFIVSLIFSDIISLLCSNHGAFLGGLQSENLGNGLSWMGANKSKRPHVVHGSRLNAHTLLCTMRLLPSFLLFFLIII